MAHLNSAEGIQNMCATQIMAKSKSLRTGFSSQGRIRPGANLLFPKCITNFNLFPSQSHEKTGGNPVPLPEEWLPFPPTPVLFFLPITVNYSQNIVQITRATLLVE